MKTFSDFDLLFWDLSKFMGLVRLHFFLLYIIQGHHAPSSWNCSMLCTTTIHLDEIYIMSNQLDLQLKQVYQTGSELFLWMQSSFYRLGFKQNISQ